MMQTKLLAIALCLLGAVILCKGQTSASTESPISPSASDSPTISPSEPSSEGTEGPGVSTEGPDASTDSPTITGTPVAPTTVAPDEGLSDGAIAGIVIGTIAGVAVLGGGIYGLLKCTGKV